MNILIDIDGVCFDFATQFGRWLFVTGRTSELHTREETHTYDLGVSWGLKNVGQLILDYSKDSWFYGARPTPDCIRVIKTLARDNHYLRFVTQKPRGNQHKIEMAVRGWLFEHFREEKVTITWDSVHDLNTRRWLQTESDLCIDDNTQNVIMSTAGGTDAVLFAQPWNEFAQVGLLNLHTHGKATRVGTWDGIYGVVRKMLEANPGKHWHSYPAKAKGEK